MMLGVPRNSLPLFLGAFGVLLAPAPSVRGDSTDPAELAGLHGGLVVQLGGSDVTAAAELSLTGRYLIHVLDVDDDCVAAAQQQLRGQGYYGLAWAERLLEPHHLPYAENVVNLVYRSDGDRAAIATDELMRVLAPGGHVVIAKPDPTDRAALKASGFDEIVAVGPSLVASKPWPIEMDIWSHPRHAADGNAVSLDTLVGPPERVRWIAAATSEVEGMVTAGGRNFYGGVLARDSFNGLRLWHRTLNRADTLNAEEFALPRLAREGSRPVASHGLVFAVLQDRPVALNAATGEVVVELGDLQRPSALVHDGVRVIAADNQSVRAFDVGTGNQLWTVPAVEPRQVIADGRYVSLIRGQVRRGEQAEAVVVDAATGKLLWHRDDYPWLTLTTRTVMAGGMLVFEVSTLNDHDQGNGIHVVAIDTGEHQWSKDFPPGMNHARQARAMYLEGDLWILHGGKLNTNDEQNRSRAPTEISALDPRTGETRRTLPAGLTHCFPPVATPNYMFAGELDMTDLSSGEVIANRITKANCSRESGWIPANGLVYTTPKHCTCWPMLRGFVAMAPASSDPSRPANLPVDQLTFLLEKGPASIDPEASAASDQDWPLYRHDRWRSGSAVTAGPDVLQRKWSLALKDENERRAKISGPILHDWKENPVVKGPLSPPTIAHGIAYVARPDAHELIAIETASGTVRWRFTANGRIDTPPAIHKGLCLFGTAAGWVYAIRADDGGLVWRLRAAPSDERIVAYGQVESPWPVPGAVLVMDDIAYFAAGRQPLADGGILVFAVDPLTGDKHWVQRIDSVPQKGFYENSGLEFDPFDLLHAEGDGLAMSRWILSRDGKQVDVDKWNAFAKLDTGAGEVWIPRGTWTYGARHQHRFSGEASRRPLTSFRDDDVYSSLDGSTQIFRRSFKLDEGETFDNKWITGWEAGKVAREGGTPYRSYRIAKNAQWTKDPFAESETPAEQPKYGTQLHNEIHAMALAGNDKLYVVHRDGRLKEISTETGYVIREMQVPEPAWDGLAIAENRLYLTTQTGEVICIGR
jgi:outer membrane protein assembly factor BamB